MAAWILRCSDGHLFSATRLKLTFLSAHLYDRVWLRCPVDHKWRTAKPVRVFEAGAVPEADLNEAMQHRF